MPDEKPEYCGFLETEKENTGWIFHENKHSFGIDSGA